MPRTRTTNSGRLRRGIGLALLTVGLGLTIAFAISAKWWFGYGTNGWTADVGDGTLYTTSQGTAAVGWCGGVNHEFLPTGGTTSWMWTWWAWGDQKNSRRSGIAYTIWPNGPIALLAGGLLYWPGSRAARRRRRNQCERCAYSLAGLSADCVCPECGKQRGV